jgi:Protein of unknown function (DUF4231)
MSSQEALQYLEAEIQKRITSFDDKRKFYQKKAEQLNISTAILSAFTTVCIGVSQAYDYKPIATIALVTSAGMAVLTAVDGFYSYRRLWVRNNDTLMNLRELRSNINYAKAAYGENLTIEDIDRWRDKYQEILRAANAAWQEERLIEPKKN